MIGLGFIQRNAIALLGGLLVATSSFAVVQTVRIDGLGIGPVKIEGLKAKASRLEGEASAARKAAAEAGKLRDQEQGQDQASFSAQSTRCAERTIQAVDAGRAIEEITRYDAIPVPAADSGRGIVGAGQLRRIVGQPSAAQAAVVPAGSNGTAGQ